MEELDAVPVVVMAAEQTAGRGRSGSEWITADRALAVSLALAWGHDDSRPLSLMAGVAAVRATGETRLKWPNDLLVGETKVGGILVERHDKAAVVGLGLNLWWPRAPEGMGALYGEDPGPERHAEIGGLWAAELMRLIEDEGWPREEYRRLCDTLGRAVAWEPDGSGRAVDVAEDGALLVEDEGEVRPIYSGEVRHLKA